MALRVGFVRCRATRPDVDIAKVCFATAESGPSLAPASSMTLTEVMGHAGAGGWLIVESLAEVIAAGIALSALIEELDERRLMLCSIADDLDPASETYRLTMKGLRAVAGKLDLPGTLPAICPNDLVCRVLIRPTTSTRNAALAQ